MNEQQLAARVTAPAIALLPDDAPFSPDQRAWLNGFFAGLLTQLARQTAAVAPRLRLPVLYASQTGSAESLARKLAKEARSRGFDSQAQALGALSLEQIAKLEHALIIASTHGEGEPPDTASVFAMQLEAAQGTPLAGMKYAVLALGDRNYSSFCQFGRRLDERFDSLGAKRLIDRVEADNAVDEPFKQFRERLWPRLQHPAPMAAPQTQADEDDDGTKEVWTRQRPYPAPLRSRQRLSGPGSDKEVRHIVLSLSGSNLRYEPGDAIGVWPRNAPELVQQILTLCACPPDAAVQCDGATLALAEALASRREIAKLSIPTVIKFARLTADPELLALVRPESSKQLEKFLFGRDAADLLARGPDAFADPQSLIDLLPPLTPRLYSICSTLAAHSDEVHLTISVVRYLRDSRERGGVASTDIADRIGVGETIPVYVHRNTRFRLPGDPATPIIMIGPGTGIAPFRAFLHQRKALDLTGRTWLFFGDRRAHCDFLYREELETFLHDGTLSRLDVAFSRDQAQKNYVQHRMLEAGRELWSWIQDGAHIFVCGDATRMAKDVDAALQRILVEHGAMSEAAAQLELRIFGASGRYVRDVY